MSEVRKGVGRRPKDKTDDQLGREMKNIEKHQFKITISVAVIVILFIITWTYAFARWKTTVENTFKYTIVSVDEHHDKIQKLETESISSKVQLATIKTKLANIETLLIEIKEKVK